MNHLKRDFKTICKFEFFCFSLRCAILLFVERWNFSLNKIRNFAAYFTFAESSIQWRIWESKEGPFNPRWLQGRRKDSKSVDWGGISNPRLFEGEGFASILTEIWMSDRPHGSYKWIIMHEKWGRPDSNGFQLKWRFGTHSNWKKSKSWGPFWSYQLNSTANSAHLAQFLR